MGTGRLGEKLPRGHAYIRIRNKGFSMHMDFRGKDVPFVESMLKLIMDKHAEWVQEQRKEQSKEP